MSRSALVLARGAASRTGSLEPLAIVLMMPASESGRSWLAACSTPADAKTQINIATVAPESGPDEVHVLEAFARLRDQRKALFDADAVEHRSE